MKRRELFGMIAGCFASPLASIVPVYAISVQPQVKYAGCDKKNIFMECKVIFYANGKQIDMAELDRIIRHAELGLCKVESIIVNEAI